MKEKNMAVMLSKDEKELVVTCGCNRGKEKVVRI
jgi:hypothetical protein